MADSTPFTDIPRKELEPRKEPQYLESVRTLQVGFGSKVLRADQQGIWLGAEDFASAPFSVDMDGNLVANNVSLSGYIEVGDALSDIGSGNITSTYIGDNQIIASKISVSDLAAINADLGTITSGDIRGARIRTSTTGDRVEISDSTDSIRIYDGGDLRIEIVEDRITFSDDAEDEIASIYATTLGNLLIAATDISADLLISSERDIILSSGDDITLTADDSITLNCTDLADDIYIGLGGNTFMQFANGRVYLDTYFDMQGFDITDGGDFTCVSLTETSDIRLKEDVQPLHYGLDAIIKLNPIRYKFKDGAYGENKALGIKGKDDSHFGFSAQDVYKIMPELTKHAEENSKEKARLYSTQLIPVLVQAIKDLNERIDQMEGVKK